MNIFKRIGIRIFLIAELAFLSLLPKPEKFYVKKGYRHRLFCLPVDTGVSTDHHQEAVYQYTRKVFEENSTGEKHLLNITEE